MNKQTQYTFHNKILTNHQILINYCNSEIQKNLKTKIYKKHKARNFREVWVRKKLLYFWKISLKI